MVTAATKNALSPAELQMLAWPRDKALKLTELDRSAALAAIDGAVREGTLAPERAGQLRAVLLGATLDKLELLRAVVAEPPSPRVAVEGAERSTLLELRVSNARQSSPGVRESLAVWWKHLGQPVAVSLDDAVRGAILREVRVGTRRETELRVETSTGARLWVSERDVRRAVVDETPATIDESARPLLHAEFEVWLLTRTVEFPRLTHFELVSGPSRAFNCIANTVHDEEHWVWPGSRVQDFDALYRERGFVPMTDLDFRWCPGFEKVVLYAHTPDAPAYAATREKHQGWRSVVDDGPLCLHCIVQDDDGGWVSKMGSNARIKVSHPDALAGGDYGQPLKVYIRPTGEERPG